MGICLATAAILYVDALSQLFGNRALIEWIHVIAGIGCHPFHFRPAIKGFRADAGRLNRFTSNDWKWLRSRQRRDGIIPVGKFNAGQKLNANFQIGAILTMLGTGSSCASRISGRCRCVPAQRLCTTGCRTRFWPWCSATCTWPIAIRTRLRGMRTGYVRPPGPARTQGLGLARNRASEGDKGQLIDVRSMGHVEPIGRRSVRPGVPG